MGQFYILQHLHSTGLFEMVVVERPNEHGGATIHYVDFETYEVHHAAGVSSMAGLLRRLGIEPIIEPVKDEE